MPVDDPSLIDYASQETISPPSVPYLESMMRWRSRCWTQCWISAVIAVLYGSGTFSQTETETLAALSVQAICLTGLIACALVTLIYMTKAAAEAGTSYAVRQLALAVILSPLLLLGIFVVPVLVQSDLLKWRKVD